MVCFGMADSQGPACLKADSEQDLHGDYCRELSHSGGVMFVVIAQRHLLAIEESFGSWCVTFEAQNPAKLF